MKKYILPLISIFYLTIVNSQEINENRDGYVQIIESKLTQNAINLKLKEWIAINYNKSEEVINFESKDKIIIKTLIPFDYAMYDRNLDRHQMVKCYISNNLIFSTRDNKFKIDFIPNNIETTDKYLVAQRWFYEELMTSKTRTKEEYIENKKSSKNDLKTLNEHYLDYVKNKNHFNKMVKELYASIRYRVNSIEKW